MKTKINGELKYGRSTLIVELETDASGAVALVGPNLTGKSLLMRCLYQMGKTRIGRPVQTPPELTCEVEREDYVAIYVDAFRVVSQLYESSIQEKLEVIKKNAEDLLNDRDVFIRKIGDIINREALDIEQILGDSMFLLYLKKHADDVLISEAVNLLDELYAEFMKKAEKARAELGELFDDFFPLAISRTVESFVWTDKKANVADRGLHQLSTAFVPAMVVLYAVYAYAIPDTYLLIEEPEAFAHPLTSYFIGAYLRRLVRRNNRFNVVVSTHSFDFLRGFWDEAAKVYVFKRLIDGNKVFLKVVDKWQGEGYVPGFTDVAIYKLL